ncbi:MAG: hypothetical protein AABX05_02175 [Nanoarchaeota archaeon]
MKNKLIAGLAALMASSYSPKLAAVDSNYHISHEAAQCLADNSVLYGNEGCHWCDEQKKEFGSEWETFKSSYIECSSSRVSKMICEQEKISSYPTWKFKNGKVIEGYKPLEEVVKIAGCD